MTRIGRCQIKFPTTLLAMHPTGETTSPRSKFYQTASINMPTSLGCSCRSLEDAAVNTLTPPDPQAFFENRIPGVGCIAVSSEPRVT